MLWGFCRLGRRWAVCAVAGGWLLWAAALLALRHQVFAQARQILQILGGVGEGGALPADLAMGFFAAALVLMLVSLEFLLGWYTLACAAVAVSVLLGPLAGIRPTAASVVCAALFLVSFRAVQVAGTHQRRSSASPMARGKLAAASGKWMAAVLAVALLVALPAGIHGAKPLWNAAYAAEGLVFRTARQQDASRPVTGGAISRSNNYRTGTEHLFLRADRQPTEPLYLRGFSGGDWASANDEEIFRQMSTAEAPRVRRPGAPWRAASAAHIIACISS